MSNGLVTYSYAQPSSARTAIRSDPCAVSMMTGSDSSRSRIDLSNCRRPSPASRSRHHRIDPVEEGQASAPDGASTAFVLARFGQLLQGEQHGRVVIHQSRRAIVPPRKRQDSERRGASAYGAGVLERASVLHERRGAREQPEPGAILARGEEGRADLLETSGGMPKPESRTAISTALSRRRSRFPPYRRAASLALRSPTRLNQGLFQSPRIRVDAGLAATPQRHAGARRIRCKKLEQLLDQRAEIHPLALELPERTREREVLLEDGVHPLDLRLGDAQPLARFRIGRIARRELHQVLMAPSGFFSSCDSCALSCSISRARAKASRANDSRARTISSRLASSARVMVRPWAVAMVTTAIKVIAANAVFAGSADVGAQPVPRHQRHRQRGHGDQGDGGDRYPAPAEDREERMIGPITVNQEWASQPAGQRSSDMSAALMLSQALGPRSRTRAGRMFAQSSPAKHKDHPVRQPGYCACIKPNTLTATKARLASTNGNGSGPTVRDDMSQGPQESGGIGGAVRSRSQVHAGTGRHPRLPEGRSDCTRVRHIQPSVRSTAHRQVTLRYKCP